MKTENFTWGLVLVFVGAVLLLDNFNVIDFYWNSVWKLWPLILVIGGANIIFSGSDSKAVAAISIFITIAALAFIGYSGTQYPADERGWWSENKGERRDEEVKRDWTNSSFSEPYEGTIRRAKLNISGGATVYTLEDTTSNLFDADVNHRWGNYSLQRILKDSIQILNFRMRNKGKSWNSDGGDGNKVNIRLNSKPLWDISLETGAGETEFDLTPFKVSNLQIKGGAASFDLKLGEPVTTTNVLAETGVAEFKIAVPATVGCKIEIQSGLSSRNFQGFTQQADGSFITSNYNSSLKKININLKGGLSDFEVDRY
jgi:hypothetical protein